MCIECEHGTGPCLDDLSKGEPTHPTNRLRAQLSRLLYYVNRNGCRNDSERAALKHILEQVQQLTAQLGRPLQPNWKEYPLVQCAGILFRNQESGVFVELDESPADDHTMRLYWDELCEMGDRNGEPVVALRAGDTVYDPKDKK